MKTLETPEEKRARRLQKKELKERKRKEARGWDHELLHYTNADNPYGDNNLLDTFVWRQKLQSEGLGNLPIAEIEKRNLKNMEENRQELEKVKKRRKERELERAERDQQIEMEQREREASEFSQFSKGDDRFVLGQARLRSQIRVEEGRAKPIDLLAQYIGSTSGDKTASTASVLLVQEPTKHLEKLTLTDLEDLMEDIKVYQLLDTENIHSAYWSDLTTIVCDEIRRLRMRGAAKEEGETSSRQGVHSSVAKDVTSTFQNKTASDLEKLQQQIEDKLANQKVGVDIGYWESILSQLKAYQARARLEERHRENLKQKLQILREEQGVLGVNTEEATTSSPKKEEQEEEEMETDQKPEVEEEDSDQAEEPDQNEEVRRSEALLSFSMSAYAAGRFSPRRLERSVLEPGTVVEDDDEDMKRLEWAREAVKVKGASETSELTMEERRMRREAENNMTGEEAQFSVEARLDPQKYLWSDKYRPRKPRYFNRVHTGFEWNKYNQTHYDMDNPPPKIVQGYKFNIFFPDLIVKSDTPMYDIIPIKDNPDFAMLKFTSGPPYEDIAFKIVNREWEYSYKRGFRCHFQNNIFQLWFHFKRYRYRR